MSRFLSLHFILPILASLLCLSAKAEIHMEAGMGVSGISGNIPTTGARAGGCLGAGYNVSIGRTLVLDPMLQLSLQGKEAYGILYAKLPVILYVKAANFDIGVGPYAAYGIWNEYHEPSFILDEPEPGTYLYPDFNYASDYFKPFDIGVMFKIRYNFSHLYLGMEESYGLRDIGRYYHYERYQDHEFHGYNFSVNFCVGI